jgi:hypothetical protein
MHRINPLMVTTGPGGDRASTDAVNDPWGTREPDYRTPLEWVQGGDGRWMPVHQLQPPDLSFLPLARSPLMAGARALWGAFTDPRAPLYGYNVLNGAAGYSEYQRARAEGRSPWDAFWAALTVTPRAVTGQYDRPPPSWWPLLLRDSSFSFWMRPASLSKSGSRRLRLG